MPFINEHYGCPFSYLMQHHKKVFYYFPISFANNSRTTCIVLFHKMSKLWHINRLIPEIQEARHNCDYHHKKKDAVNYKYWRNKVTELMKNAKEQYYKIAIEEKKNSKDIWKHIKELGPKSEHATPNMLNVNGQIANENIDIANIFNDYFINLSTVLSSNNNMNTGYTKGVTESSQCFFSLEHAGKM